MVDTEKMKALAAKAREESVALMNSFSEDVFGTLYEAADAIDTLLAALEANRQMLNGAFERQQDGFERCFEALRDDGETERSWSSLVLEIKHIRAALEAAAADKRNLRTALVRIQAIPCKLDGGDWDEIEEARTIAREALSQRQEES
ncbi:hypothetical protein [Burkholderia multivorans]|uniref:hypothetical protein n=1 Tax=Burkholderia multivorans TaxID=87883 RepID=UPI0009E0DD8F|nr:hypothetical protein [Burkholderia multivorans]MDN8078333.1 hypothetical protein [Burkholderia multivorans]SAJ91511.1 hypothetical protein UA11_04723 [Burkholderia multivorans]